MKKILVATEKPFAPVAIKGIREVTDAAGYELVLLEKYTSKQQLLEAVADVDAIIKKRKKNHSEATKTFYGIAGFEQFTQVNIIK